MRHNNGTAKGEPCFIELAHVSRIYPLGPNALTALRDVSLRIEQGKFVAIIGPSGSGKSTLLNLIAGIDRPTNGRVFTCGAPVSEMDENALAKWRGDKVGLVFQFFQLLPTLTTLENVMLPMEFRASFPGQRRQRAAELLARVGLSERLSHLPGELSGGEQQRVAIARALANDPPLLLADEPTGNLDTANSQGIVELLEEIHRKGVTVLLVTHEEQLASMAQRIIRMADGRIVEDTATADERR
jgi:putative ABC transport system ATP-binding protein